MSSIQWAVPLVLGLLAAGLTWYVPEEINMPQQEGVQIRSDSPYVLLPLPTADHHGALLRYNATDTLHGLGGILDIHPGHMHNGTFWWTGGGWECVREPACAVEETPIAVAGAGAGSLLREERGAAERVPGAGEAEGGAAGIRVGPDHSTANLTFYMFTSSGRLLATNAPRSDWEVYDLHGEFTAFAQHEWHLGEGPAPAGAARVPLREEAYQILNGTPVGGVQSAVLEHHRYDWLIGPVWMTARVEP